MYTHDHFLVYNWTSKVQFSKCPINHKSDLLLYMHQIQPSLGAVQRQFTTKLSKWSCTDHFKGKKQQHCSLLLKTNLEQFVQTTRSHMYLLTARAMEKEILCFPLFHSVFLK